MAGGWERALDQLCASSVLSLIFQPLPRKSQRLGHRGPGTPVPLAIAPMLMVP